MHFNQYASISLSLLHDFINTALGPPTGDINDCYICCFITPKERVAIQNFVKHFSNKKRKLKTKSLVGIALLSLRTSDRIHCFAHHMRVDAITSDDKVTKKLLNLLAEHPNNPGPNLRSKSHKFVNVCINCKNVTTSWGPIRQIECVPCTLVAKPKKGKNKALLLYPLRRLAMCPWSRITEYPKLLHRDYKWTDQEAAYKKLTKYIPTHRRLTYTLTELMKVTGFSRHWLLANLSFSVVRNAMESRKVSKYVIVFKMSTAKKQLRRLLD